MALAELFIPSDDIHPIDIVESVAAHHEWEFDRLADDQIAMIVDGQWRSYSITLAWSAREEMLRLVCTFDFDPPEARMAALHDILNLANDQVWDGGFVFWEPQRLMIWRYGLVLSSETAADPAQVDRMIRAAVEESERFYPAFQLACWGDAAPAAALDIALGRAYGRA